MLLYGKYYSKHYVLNEPIHTLKKKIYFTFNHVHLCAPVWIYATHV